MPSTPRALLSALLLSIALAATNLVAADVRQANPDYALGLRHYESGRFKSAVAAFEKAAAREPENDVFAYWLGKACGRVAEKAGPLSAMKWAGRTRDALERAVELNPDNRDAVSSLADYYEQAPGFLGGDVAKARALRARLAALPVNDTPVSGSR